ncbi:MAG: DUF2007 domain-containing protein [Spirosomaceae bacterium]|jgi:hypothetical protein|nr:DUF2007 domain-containing protein [Spirosomataceae bacterium]
MIPQNWEKVYTTSFQHRAEIVCDYLQQQNIAAVVINKQDSSYLFGKCEVYVPAESAALAQIILTNEIHFE